MPTGNMRGLLTTSDEDEDAIHNHNDDDDDDDAGKSVYGIVVTGYKAPIESRGEIALKNASA
jgi:hypothetical protein